jgi:YD repeat-containing protein
MKNKTLYFKYTYFTILLFLLFVFSPKCVFSQFHVGYETSKNEFVDLSDNPSQTIFRDNILFLPCNGSPITFRENCITLFDEFVKFNITIKDSKGYTRSANDVLGYKTSFDGGMYTCTINGKHKRKTFNHFFRIYVSCQDVDYLKLKGFVSEEKVCSYDTYSLFPNGSDGRYDYVWKDQSGHVVTNFQNLKLQSLKSTQYTLEIEDKISSVRFPQTKKITYKDTPPILTAAPFQTIKSCGVMELSNKKNQSDAWYNYFRGNQQQYDLDVDIYYASDLTSCNSKSNLSQNGYNVTKEGINQLYYIAFNHTSNCWSDCSSFKVTLNEAKPIAPVVTDVIACLCDFNDVTLHATNLNTQNTMIRWYTSGTGNYTTGANKTVPRVDDTYYVSTYNSVNLCESDRIPISVITNPCNNCNSQFSPSPGKYVVSAWVKEAKSNAISYTNGSVSFSFDGVPQKVGPFYPSGPIIDGWQKIESEFIIPDNAYTIYVELNNNGNTSGVYFDDIRIHPFESTMTSYVYDPETLRLVAESDDHNYTTFYTYDDEGNLVSIKKETFEGIKTIKEQRNILNTNTYKRYN